MPVLNNEQLDDPLGYDFAQDFSGGMVAGARASILQLNQYSYAENVTIERNGLLKTRPGVAEMGDLSGYIAGTAEMAEMEGMVYFDAPTDERLFVWIEGTHYAYTEAAGWQEGTGYSTSAGRQVETAQLVDRLYAVDGVQPLHKYSGGAWSEVAGTATVPSGCAEIVGHTNRLFASCCAAEPDAVWVSDLLDGDVWDTTMWKLRIGAGDGEPVVALGTWHGYWLAVLKAGSVYVVNADPGASSAADWTVEVVSRSVGCVARRTAVQVGLDVFFLSWAGVHSLQRTASDEQLGVTEAISSPQLDPLMERVNWSAIDQAHAVSWRGRYILALPLDGAEVATHCVVYNAITRSWEGVWTGWDPQAFAVSRFSDLHRLHVAGRGAVATWNDWKEESLRTTQDYLDMDAAYETVLLTRGFTVGEHVSPKTGYFVEGSFNYVTDSDELVLDVVTDELDQEVQRAPVPVQNQLPVDLPFDLSTPKAVKLRANLMDLGQWREMQVRVSTASGNLALRGLLVAAFIDTLDEREGVFQ